MIKSKNWITSWASYIACQWFSFLPYKMGIIRIPTSHEGGREAQVFLNSNLASPSLTTTSVPAWSFLAWNFAITISHYGKSLASTRQSDVWRPGLRRMLWEQPFVSGSKSSSALEGAEGLSRAGTLPSPPQALFFKLWNWGRKVKQSCLPKSRNCTPS